MSTRTRQQLIKTQIHTHTNHTSRITKILRMMENKIFKNNLSTKTLTINFITKTERWPPLTCCSEAIPNLIENRRFWISKSNLELGSWNPSSHNHGMPENGGKRLNGTPGCDPWKWWVKGRDRECKLVYFTYLRDLQPTYIGVIIHLLRAMDTLAAIVNQPALTYPPRNCRPYDQGLWTAGVP